MKQGFLLLCLTFFSLVGLKAQTLPTTSTNGNEVWYYIQSAPRSTDATAKWLSGGPDGTVITNAVFSRTDDAQLWKVVANAGGIALVNKKGGTYLNADITYNSANLNLSVLPCITAAPATGLKLVPYVDQVAVPGGFYLVDKDATTIDNSANATPKFQFYSAAAGSTFRPINYGTGAPNANSAISFFTPKSLLLVAINTAKNLKSNASVGFNPGQFSQDDIDAITGQIDAAQLIYDDPNATSTQVFDITDETYSITQFVLSNVIFPQISTTTSEYWYYIQGTRYANTYLTAGAAGSLAPPTNLAIANTDFQLWKMVPNTKGSANGFTLVNKATGEYVDADQVRIMNMIPTMPNNNLRFIAHTTFINKMLLFRVENTTGSTPVLRMHSDADSKAIVNWTGNANITSDWLFVSVDVAAKIQLSNAIANAKQLYTASASNTGEEFGQYSTASRTALNDAIQLQDVKDISSLTPDELVTSLAEINAATSAFKMNSDASFLASSNTKYKYFNIKVKQSNKYLIDNGVGTKLAQVATLNATADNQLWRFEETGPGSGIYTLTSKLGHKAKWVAADERYEMLTEGDGFTIGFTTPGVTVLHRDGGNYFNCWAGDAIATPGNTQVGEYTVFGDAFNLLNISYVQAVAVEALIGEINASQGAISVAQVGTLFGQYTQVAVDKLAAAVQTAIAVRDGSVDQTVRDAAAATLATARAEFASAPKVMPVVSTSTGATYYNIKFVQSGKYITDLGTTTKISQVSALTVGDASQLWRVEVGGTPGTYTLVSKLGNKMNWSATDERYLSAVDGTLFDLTIPAIGYVLLGRSGSVQYVNGWAGDVVATPGNTQVGEYDVSGDAFNTLEFIFAETVINAVHTATLNFKVAVVNRKLVVTGTTAPVQAFTVTGTQVDATKALMPGIYLVRVAGQTCKVNIN